MKLKPKQEIVDLINKSEWRSHSITKLYNACFEEICSTNPLYDYEPEEDPSPEEIYENLKNDLEQVYFQSYGDGNALDVTMLIKPYSLYISFEGTDSSYGDIWFEKCYISVPYEHKEIRYKKEE